ncbi:MAG TPA: hypothetical protein VLH19_05390 [Patescibacteria group bacterium]|nr:hypothetical protein [Patescibacteria group bacterium]
MGEGSKWKMSAEEMEQLTNPVEVLKRQVLAILGECPFYHEVVRAFAGGKGFSARDFGQFVIEIRNQKASFAGHENELTREKNMRGAHFTYSGETHEIVPPVVVAPVEERAKQVFPHSTDVLPPVETGPYGSVDSRSSRHRE